jgi:hypothetical protein
LPKRSKDETAQQTKQAPLEFKSAEELLRHDAAQISVPPAIAARLGKSTGEMEPPRGSWWRRWIK